MKRLFSLLLSVVLIAVLTVPAIAVTGFTDIPTGSTLTSEIEKASQYGLMQGYNTTTFGYYQKITRAQFAAVLVRMFGWEAETPAVPSFTDVPTAHYWYSSIETAANHDVMDSGGAFRPSDPITRAEMSEMLVRALGYKSAAKMAVKDTLPFTDVSGSSRGYIAVAYEIGMTKGMTATTFVPSTSATRAQAAAMLVRIYEKLHQDTSWIHGFYAISSYSQLSLAGNMDAVSAGWSKMTWDGTTASLSTTSANSNEFYIPSGYADVASYLSNNSVPLNLSVYMDTSGSLAGLLSSTSGRSQAVAQIVNELTVSYKTVGKNPYSGVTIDFEGLRSSQKTNFNAFLADLSKQVKAMGKTLYVCVSPVLTTSSYYDGYDYRTIGNLADKVILMAYDYDARSLDSFVGTEYYKTAAPTPIDQVYESLRAVTDPTTGVQDSSKIVLGFSCKNVAWKVNANGKLASGTPVYPSNATVSQRLGQASTVQGWSDTYQMPYATYTAENGDRYFLWYQNSRSVKAELNLAKLFGITGISLWRLGNIPNDSSWNWESLSPSLYNT